MSMQSSSSRPSGRPTRLWSAMALAVAITHAQLRKRSLLEAMHRGAA